MTHICKCVGSSEFHPTFGACVRAKRIRVAFCGQGGGDASTDKAWCSNLEKYRDLRTEGIQPDSTRPQDVALAERMSDAQGSAYVGRR